MTTGIDNHVNVYCVGCGICLGSAPSAPSLTFCPTCKRLSPKQIKARAWPDSPAQACPGCGKPTGNGRPCIACLEELEGLSAEEDEAELEQDEAELEQNAEA